MPLSVELAGCSAVVVVVAAADGGGVVVAAAVESCLGDEKRTEVFGPQLILVGPFLTFLVPRTWSCGCCGR